MSLLLHLLLPLALGAVTLVLMMGFYNMARGGTASMSQKLMRWRVGLQLLAVLLVMMILWLAGR